MRDETWTANEPDVPTDVDWPRDRQVTRRTILKTAGAGALALSGSSLLAACGGTGSTASGSGNPVRGGTLTVGMITAGSVESVNPWIAVNLPDIARIVNLYDGLFELDATGVKPSLAESAEPNSNATRWTIRIRDGVTFHNGAPLTADDVVYTIRGWLNPKNTNDASAIAPLIDGKGVRKRDRLTVEVPLLRPVAEFPSLAAFYASYVIPNNSTYHQLSSQPIGTGPFKFESFVPGKRSEFVANRDYWRAAPNVDKLVIDSSFTSDTARGSALQAHDIDTAPQLGYIQAKANASGGALRIGSAVGASYYAFAMNVTAQPFTDVRVRQAMRLLADRPGLVEGALNGYGTPGNDLLGHGMPYFASDLVRQQDVEQARALLKAAGQDGLNVTLDTSDIVDGAVQAATLFANQAKAGGVNVTVHQIDPADYFNSSAGYLKRPFSFTYTGGSDLTSLTYIWIQVGWSGCPFPETHFGNKQTDTLLFDAIGETNKEKATEKWHAYQELQFDQGGYLAFANPNYVDGYTLAVKGLDTTFAGWNDNFAYRKAWLQR